MKRFLIYDAYSKNATRIKIMREFGCVRSKFLNVLQHSFVTHEFIKIYAILEELSQKTDVEKEEL